MEENYQISQNKNRKIFIIIVKQNAPF